MTEPLFTPFTCRGVTARNRTVISPMCQYRAHEGHMDDWHLVHLGRFAMGGAGIIFAEATAVQKSGRITHGCPGLWDDSQIASHARVTQFLTLHGAVPAVQLGHAGRKSGMQRPWYGNGPLGPDDTARGDMGWTPVGPSDAPVADGWPMPHALNLSEIDQLVDDYCTAAARAIAAGYKIIELHAAHGYLLHSFLSPLSNLRTDAYGGDRAGRMRLPLRIAAALRDVMPDDMPLFLRISAVDGAEGGWDLDDSVALATAAKPVGVDVIDCSSGGIAGAATAAAGGKRQPGFQVPFADRIRREAGIPTMAVGLITHPQQANDIIAQGQADLAAIAREALYDPNWPLHAAQYFGADPSYDNWPQQSGWWLARRDESCDFYQPQ